MDDNTRAVWEAVITVAGTLLAVFLGFVTGLVAERSRRKYEDRHRFTETKRAAYLRTVNFLDRLTDSVIDNPDDPNGGLAAADYTEFVAIVNELRLFAPQPVRDVLTEYGQLIPSPGHTLQPTELRAAFDKLVGAMRIDLGMPG